MDISLRNKLYDLAFEYYQTKLWKRLWDSEIFSCKLEGDRIGYISIMGKAGSFIGVALYIGDVGLNSLQMIRSKEQSDDPLADFEELLSQECLMCSFESEWNRFKEEEHYLHAYCSDNDIKYNSQKYLPAFERYRCNCVPWKFSNQDARDMILALQCCLEVNQKLGRRRPKTLGIMENKGFDQEVVHLEKRNDDFIWDKVIIRNPETVARYEKGEFTNSQYKSLTKKCDESWMMDIFVSPGAVQSNKRKPPYFPYILLIVNPHIEMIYTCVAAHEVNSIKSLNNEFYDVLKQQGLPKSITVKNERTYAFCEDICERLDIKLKVEMFNDDVLDIEMGLFDKYAHQHDEDAYRDMVDEVLKEVDLSIMPDDTLFAILNASINDEVGLSDEVMDKLFAELERRKYIDFDE